MSDQREQLNEMKKFMKIAEGPEHSRLGQFIKKTKDGVELNIPVNKTFQTKGDGLWSDVAKDVAVTHMSLEVEPDDEEEKGYWARDLGVFYDENTWDNYDDGLIYTDSLFEKQVRKFLIAAGIPNKIVKDVGYSEQGMQEDGRVSLDAYELGDMVARLAGLNKPITEGEERPYICYHAKRGEYECNADSSYDAAQKAAKALGLDSTAGITVNLADVKQSTQFVGENGDPDDTDWDAHWAREDGDDERADDLEWDAEWARMDDELDEDANDNWGVGDYVVTTWQKPGKYDVPLKVTGVYGDQVRVVDDYGNSELMFPEDLRLAPDEVSEERDRAREWTSRSFNAVGPPNGPWHVEDRLALRDNIVAGPFTDQDEAWAVADQMQADKGKKEAEWYKRGNKGMWGGDVKLAGLSEDDDPDSMGSYDILWNDETWKEAIPYDLAEKEVERILQIISDSALQAHDNNDHLKVKKVEDGDSMEWQVLDPIDGDYQVVRVQPSDMPAGYTGEGIEEARNDPFYDKPIPGKKLAEPARSWGEILWKLSDRELTKLYNQKMDACGGAYNPGTSAVTPIKKEMELRGLLTAGPAAQGKSDIVKDVADEKGLDVKDFPLSEEDEELPPIHAIARDIIRNWKKVNFAAVPYLDAMQSLSTRHDDYGADSGSSILAYGLGNMSHYSGRSVHDPELAKKHREQLKRHLKEGIDLNSIVESVLEEYPGQPKDYVDNEVEVEDEFEQDRIDPEIEDEELGLRFD